MKSFFSINPFDQSIIAEHPVVADSELDTILKKAEKAFEVWSEKSYSQRAEILLKAGELLRSEKENHARTMSLEMGKILNEARAEVEKCANACDYYAESGEQFMHDESILTEAKKSFVAFQPVGAVFAIMPWNYPYWQVIRAAAPTLMAGNVMLLKHAPNVSMCAKAIEKVFLEAGAPEGVFQSVIIDVDRVEKIISSDIIQGVTLTGSERAGISVGSLAGKHIKKSVLELGGSDSLIVLEDADMMKAAAVAVQSRMQNAGQSCIAAKRWIVVEKAVNDFTNKIIEKINTLKQGNPLEDDITMGPVARLDLAEGLEKQLNESLKNGAHMLLGGRRNQSNFQPTLLNEVHAGMPAFDEELFGPIASIIKVKDENEAIKIANQSRYGLGGSVWTKDLNRGESVARKIKSGAVFVNSLMRSDARLPFGGVKKSGYGRELSKYGMHEFVNIKTIYIDH
jgi:succinate-semialdehyde dehydrogenase/glutarate-semialdehyde dehydrogenase